MSSPVMFHGLFAWESGGDGPPRITRRRPGPSLSDDGRLLRVATVDSGTAAICPSCTRRGHGGFVSFDCDLRMAYACLQCQQLVWVEGV